MKKMRNIYEICGFKKMGEILTAEKLKLNQKAVIKKIKSNDLKLKLMEMGCFSDVEIKLTYKAPLGCPLAFEINNSQLGLRKEECELLVVEII